MNALRAPLVGMAMVILACASVGTNGGGPPQAGLLGTWEGMILTPGSPLNVTMRVTDERRGTIDVRHRPFKGLALRVISGPEPWRIRIVSVRPGISASFSGVRDGEDIRGTFSEAGRSYPFFLTRTKTTV
jgi:uncharacterized protein